MLDLYQNIWQLFSFYFFIVVWISLLLLHCNESASPVSRVHKSNRGGKIEQIMEQI